MPIKLLKQRNQNVVNRLIAVWKSAVIKTHTFLSEADISAIQPEVKQGLEEIENLYGYYDDNGILQGFIGVENRKTEMLFIDADFRGRGVGKQLLNVAITELGAIHVDVNEQNEQGVGFYSHVGFHTIGRSEFDEQGRPFPILHLELKNF